ncbi:hypothetical protein [Serratia ficaria]|uniref:hypothetical protein n=1 Tax=Serratia ficaria TaxID=61651 RepID=UPI0011C03352|nr:hypothetical protein [Serratia ficaria]
MLKKLEKLGVALSKLPNGVDNPLLKRLEGYSGILPKEYCDFLANFSQGAEFDSLIVYKGIEASPWASKDGYDSLEYFYGLSNSEGGEGISLSSLKCIRMILENNGCL